MSRKLKVSFEVTDNWERDDFRVFIKELLKYTDNYEVYIISNDDSTAYIQRTGQILELDSNHILVVGFTSDKIDAITTNNIDIHLDNLLATVTRVDEETDAYGVLVNELPNKYLDLPKYIVEFNRAVERLNE